MWNNYNKVKPPKFVIFTADFGDYQDNLILDRKGLWSETDKVYITEEPNKWKIIQSTSNS